MGGGFPKIGMHKESLNILKKAERRSKFYDVGTMLIAGVIGWLMGKAKIPTSPAIPGLLVPSGPDRLHPLWRGPRTVKEKNGIAVKKKYIKI